MLARGLKAAVHSIYLVSLLDSEKHCRSFFPAEIQCANIYSVNLRCTARRLNFKYPIHRQTEINCILIVSIRLIDNEFSKNYAVNLIFINRLARKLSSWLSTGSRRGLIVSLTLYGHENGSLRLCLTSSTLPSVCCSPTDRFSFFNKIWMTSF